MAAENRTDLATTLAALAAVVDLSELKAVLTNFIDSMLMKRDVQNTVTVTGAGTTNVDFDGYDTVKVSTGYDCTLNIQNINDGDVKFLWLTKNSGVTVAFTGATDQGQDSDYLETATNTVYLVTKKFYGTVILAPLTKSFDLSSVQSDIDALETRIGTLNVTTLEIGAWDMDTSLTVSVNHGLTFSKIRSWQVTIKNDAASALSNFMDGGAVSVTSTQFVLVRDIGGDYDNTNYSSTLVNRGYITIWYVD